MYVVGELQFVERTFFITIVEYVGKVLQIRIVTLSMEFVLVLLDNFLALLSLTACWL